MAKKKKTALDLYLKDCGTRAADAPGLVLFLKAEREKKLAEKDAEAEEVYRRWLVARAKRKEREASANKENA